MGKAFDKQTVYRERLDASIPLRPQRTPPRPEAADTPVKQFTSGSASVSLKKPFCPRYRHLHQRRTQKQNHTQYGAAERRPGKRCRAELAIDSGNIRLSGKSVIHPFAESLDKTLEEVLVKGSTSTRPHFVPSLPDAGLNFDLTAIRRFQTASRWERFARFGKHQSRLCRPQRHPRPSGLGGFVIDRTARCISAIRPPPCSDGAASGCRAKSTPKKTSSI